MIQVSLRYPLQSKVPLSSYHLSISNVPLPSMTESLGLLKPETSSNYPFSQAEELRRIAWAVFCFETYAMSGSIGRAHLHPSKMRIQLPANERHFGLSIPAQTTRVTGLDSLHGPSDLQRQRDAQGLLAQFVSVMILRRRILYA